MVLELAGGLTELLSYTNKRSVVTVIDFYADWCQPCQRAKPTFRFLADRFREDHRVLFVMVNSDRHGDCSRRFNVSVLPTFICMLDGQELVRTSNVDELNRALDGCLQRLSSTAMTGGRTTGTSSSESSNPSLPVYQGQPLLTKLAQLSRFKARNDAQGCQRLAEAIRQDLEDASRQEPLGLALVPLFATEELSSAAPNTMETLLSEWNTKQYVEGNPRYLGWSSTVIGNLLRYIISCALELTWDMREGIQVLHRVLHSMLLSPTAQRLIVESAYFMHPSISTGIELERTTVLGALLGIGPVVRSTPTAMDERSAKLFQQMYLSQEVAALVKSFPAEDMDRHQEKVREMQGIVSTLAIMNEELILQLLRSRETREHTLLYLAEALRLNEGYQRTVHRDLPLSSLYFMTQLQSTILIAAKPIFDRASETEDTTLRIPTSYLLDQEGAIVSFGEEIERVSHFDAEHPLPTCPPSSPPPVAGSPTNAGSQSPVLTGGYKPATHLFFLAARALTVVTVPMVDTYTQLERQARYRPRSREASALTALVNVRKALIASREQSERRLHFINDMSRWLLSVMKVDADGNFQQKDQPPEAWGYLPQELVDAAVKGTGMAVMSSELTPSLYGLLLVLMGNRVYFPKPHTHVFSHLLSHVMADRAANARLQQHPWFRKKIVRACMSCYIAVEKATYERAQVRFDLSLLLKDLLASDSLSSEVRDEMCDPTNTSLERFSHMAVAELNEAVDQMTETLKKMNAKAKEEASNSQSGGGAAPAPVPPASTATAAAGGRGGGNDDSSDDENEERATAGQSYEEMGAGLQSHISVFFASTDLFISLTRCFPTGVSQNMVAQQLSQVFARSLVTFAGKQSSQLKIADGEKYGFVPRKILARIVDCLTPLASDSQCLRCLCECGVPKESILESIQFILDRRLVGGTHESNLEAVREAIQLGSAEVDQLNATWDDAPDFALDAVLYTPLLHPVALPAEVKDLNDLVFTNRDTIHHHLLSESSNPFTKEYLDESMVNEFNERPHVKEAVQQRKKKIREWLKEHAAGK